MYIFQYHHLLESQLEGNGEKIALRYGDSFVSYRQLADYSVAISEILGELGAREGDRVAIYLPSQIETIGAFLACSMIGCIFIPINPKLKNDQVDHIVQDSGAKILVTSRDRKEKSSVNCIHYCIESWTELKSSRSTVVSNNIVSTDPAAILYTSGSTGMPKGVVVSHQNLIEGARSVSSYLNLTANDKILAILPLSFDYGLNQIGSSLFTGCEAILQNYLFADEIPKAIERYGATGLAAVPPVWIQLARASWSEGAVRSLRYITNSGGELPIDIASQLQQILPKTHIVSMYGLTEAFRSTYLPSSERSSRPGSIGKAIPNARLYVVNGDGELCGPHEKGELVHCGPLVSLGYWNDIDRTRKIFKPSPVKKRGIQGMEMAVWSGDIVSMDEDGYLYFHGRKDDAIKTSGYRVSTEEIESALYRSGSVKEAVAFGVPDKSLGQAIVVTIVPGEEKLSARELVRFCKKTLPSYMVPTQIDIVSRIPTNPNGKYNRKALRDAFLESLGGNGI